MKPTTKPVLHRRLVLFIGLALTLWASWKVNQDAPAPTIVPERTSTRQAVKSAAVVPTLPLMWTKRSEAHSTVVDIFNQPPHPSPPPAVVMAPKEPISSSEPVFELKYIGHLLEAENQHAFLADAKENVTTVKVGQMVDKSWNFIEMDSQKLVFIHVPTGQKTTLPIGNTP